MTRITIAGIGDNNTVNYAVDELYTYLKKIDSTLFVDVRYYPEYDENAQRVIWVGESDAFSCRLLPVDDRKTDDSIYINIENNNAGIITGCNPRSVLIAVYRFLRELGVAWVRPTDDGEIVPEYRITSLEYHSDIAARITDCLLSKYQGNTDDALAKWEKTKEILKINELRYHHILDVSQFVIRMDGYIKSQVENEIINN